MGFICLKECRIGNIASWNFFKNHNYHLLSVAISINWKTITGSFLMRRIVQNSSRCMAKWQNRILGGIHEALHNHASFCKQPSYAQRLFLQETANQARVRSLSIFRISNDIFHRKKWKMYIMNGVFFEKCMFFRKHVFQIPKMAYCFVMSFCKVSVADRVSCKVM